MENIPIVKMTPFHGTQKRSASQISGENRKLQFGDST